MLSDFWISLSRTENFETVCSTKNENLYIILQFVKWARLALSERLDLEVAWVHLFILSWLSNLASPTKLLPYHKAMKSRCYGLKLQRYRVLKTCLPRLQMQVLSDTCSDRLIMWMMDVELSIRGCAAWAFYIATQRLGHTELCSIACHKNCHDLWNTCTSTRSTVVYRSPHFCWTTMLHSRWFCGGHSGYVYR